MKRVLCIWLMDWPNQRRRIAATGSDPPYDCANRDEVAGNSELARQMDRESLECLAACCHRFSPTVGLEAVENPECLLLDITGVAHLFGGELALAKQVLDEFVRRGLLVRVAIADTPGAAWAVAHVVQEKAASSPARSIRLIPPGETAAALFSLSVELLRLTEEMTDLLHSLGIQWIGQLETLPRDELPSRFGAQLLLRLDQAMGRLAEPIVLLTPSPRFEAHWILEHPVRRREILESILEHLIARVAAALVRCGQGALRLECQLDCPPDKPIQIGIGLFEPMVAVKHLFELVQLQLEQMRTSYSVTAVHVEANLTAPLEYRQQELFDEDAARRRPRELAVLIDRLTSRLGSLAVSRVRLKSESQPELAWQYDPFIGRSRRYSRRQTPTPTLPPRPLRLLVRPHRLAILAVSPDGPPMQFCFGDREYQIAHAWGPERIETGWWRGQFVGRDYFRVGTTTGQVFWLFRRLRDGQWFLHGTFE